MTVTARLILACKRQSGSYLNRNVHTRTHARTHTQKHIIGTMNQQAQSKSQPLLLYSDQRPDHFTHQPAGRRRGRRGGVFLIASIPAKAAVTSGMFLLANCFAGEGIAIVVNRKRAPCDQLY